MYNQASANMLGNIAKTMADGGVTVYSVMLMSLNYNSEQDAYDAGYQLGQQTANSYKYVSKPATNWKRRRSTATSTACSGGRTIAGCTASRAARSAA